MTAAQNPAATQDPGTTTVTGSTHRHGVVLAYRWALALLLLDVLVQFFLAGLGVFGGGFDGHVLNSIVVLALALVVFVLALVARVGVRDVLLALAVLLLAGVVQSLFRILADDGAFWGGMHALGGLAILGITGFLHGSAIRRSRAVAGP
jgi:hypothetical protein